MAADAATGKPLWSFQTNQNWKASPMTYMFDGKQYIARRGRLRRSSRWPFKSDAGKVSDFTETTP